MNEGQVFWLMQNMETTIGYASYSTIENEVFKLNKIYILPNFKGKGFGKQFLEFIEKKLVGLGVKTLQLNVNRNNESIRFYKACGYVIVNEVNIPFGDYWMNDYILRKSIIG
jgi:GNAT superfamily N-acetyltransferase